MQLHLRKLGFSLLLLSSCATAPKETVYWTKNGGNVVVHHVRGTHDQTEKLDSTKISHGEPGPNRYAVVEGSSTPVPEKKKKAKEDVADARPRRSPEPEDPSPSSSPAPEVTQNQTVAPVDPPDTNGLEAAINAAFDGPTPAPTSPDTAAAKAGQQVPQ
jgi:hypothetical protein